MNTRNKAYLNAQGEYQVMYKNLCNAFGVAKGGWDMIHRHYSPSMFCKENRLNIVGEYLVWKDFVIHAKKFDITYYCGIDDFLDEYKDAVKKCINFDW